MVDTIQDVYWHPIKHASICTNDNIHVCLYAHCLYNTQSPGHTSTYTHILMNWVKHMQPEYPSRCKHRALAVL